MLSSEIKCFCVSTLPSFRVSTQTVAAVSTARFTLDKSECVLQVGVWAACISLSTLLSCCSKWSSEWSESRTQFLAFQNQIFIRLGWNRGVYFPGNDRLKFCVDSVLQHVQNILPVEQNGYRSKFSAINRYIMPRNTIYTHLYITVLFKTADNIP